MPISRVHPRSTVLPLCLLACASLASAQEKASPSSDLDAFMEKVLARREQNRVTLQRYVLDETEAFSLVGPSRTPLLRRQREFTWYVKDGLHVRSPVRFDGVAVGEGERADYEENWARRERRRLEREREKRGGDAGAPEPTDRAAEPSPGDLTGDSPIPMPRFVSEAYFMDFKFEPGNYYLAERATLEGRDVLAIEYYPTKMFGDDREREAERERERARGRRSREVRLGDRADENRIERQMNKTALITLWIDPLEHQIVKYTFENVWMDFLPGAWLVRVDEIRASMTMGQPFPGVWLPREIDVRAGATLANGSYSGQYERRFSDYRLAEVSTRIRIP